MTNPAADLGARRPRQQADESLTASRRARRPDRRGREPLASASLDDGPPALVARVRAALRTGELALTANRAYGGRGAGETCAVCGQTIGVTDILYEVLEPRRAEAHLECYQLWQRESRRVQGGGERLGPWELI